MHRDNRIGVDSSTISKRRGACNCRPRQKSSFRAYSWVTLLSQNTYEHREDCPRFSNQNFSRTIAARITCCSRIAQFCVLVGWNQSKNAGWSSSELIFKYRPVVPYGSGVFKARNMALDYHRSHKTLGSAPPYEKTLMHFTDHLRHCFTIGEGSPFDIDEYGKGIFFVSISETSFGCEFTCLECLVSNSRPFVRRSPRFKAYLFLFGYMPQLWN